MAVQRSAFYRRTGTEQAGDLPLWDITSGGRFQVLHLPASNPKGRSLRVGPVSGAVGWRHPRRPTPYDRGLVSEAFPGDINATATALNVGTVYIQRERVEEDDVIGSIRVHISALGASPTNCYVAIFNPTTGALIGVSANQATAWATGTGTLGVQVIPLVGGPFPVSAGWIDVAILIGGGGAPSFVRGNAISGGSVNGAAAAADAQYTTANTGVTAMPATLGAKTLSTISIYSATQET